MSHCIQVPCRTSSRPAVSLSGLQHVSKQAPSCRDSEKASDGQQTTDWRQSVRAFTCTTTYALMPGAVTSPGLHDVALTVRFIIELQPSRCHSQQRGACKPQTSEMLTAFAFAQCRRGCCADPLSRLQDCYHLAPQHLPPPSKGDLYCCMIFNASKPACATHSSSCMVNKILQREPCPVDGSLSTMTTPSGGTTLMGTTSNLNGVSQC